MKLYHIGHDTYFKQMLTNTETSLRGTKRQHITYVRAAPRRRPLQLSLLLNKGLVLRPASLDLTALHPPMIQKTIEQKTQQMQWLMIVSSDDDRWTETAQPLSNLRPGSHSRQHGSRELFRKSTGITLEFPLQVRTPNVVESCQHPCPGQKLPISNWRKLGMIRQHIVIPLLHKRQ